MFRKILHRFVTGEKFNNILIYIYCSALSNPDTVGIFGSLHLVRNPVDIPLIPVIHCPYIIIIF